MRTLLSQPRQLPWNRNGSNQVTCCLLKRENYLLRYIAAHYDSGIMQYSLFFFSGIIGYILIIFKSEMVLS